MLSRKSHLGRKKPKKREMRESSWMNMGNH
jgi:hypothetical protein